MCKKTWSEIGRDESGVFEVLDKFMISEDSGLWQVVHTCDDFCEDLVNVVFAFDVFRKCLCWNVHVFVLLFFFRWYNEVKV